MANNGKYLGYKTITTDEDLIWEAIYSESTKNIFDCLENEYVYIVSPSTENYDILKWSDGKYKKLAYKTINNNFVDKIKPRNIQQQMAFDLLQSKTETIKVITGRFGSGKTFLMVANALQAIHDNKFEKIVWVRNNVGVKDTKDIGALPGNTIDKIFPYVMPLADHVGGVDGIEMLMRQGKLEVQHLGFIRGRDIKNSIILCSEAENLTKQHVQLLIGRVGEGSSLWLDGDFKQVDSKIFEENRGLNIAIDKVKGNKLFGFVHLEKSERSETAALADLLD